MKIALIGEYTPSFEPHRLTTAALEHAATRLGIAPQAEWISTQEIDENLLSSYHGVWIAPGSPYKNMEKTLSLIKRARESGVPCFGTCGGFQHMVIEYARNALGCTDAQHAEYDPYSSDLIISKLACSLFGREMELRLTPGSVTAQIYGATSVIEKYYCNFGINPEKIAFLQGGGLKAVAADAEGEVRVMELPSHPFYIGTLYVPQAQSRPDRPHPLILEFLKKTKKRA